MNDTNQTDDIYDLIAKGFKNYMAKGNGSTYWLTNRIFWFRISLSTIFLWLLITIMISIFRPYNFNWLDPGWDHNLPGIAFWFFIFGSAIFFVLLNMLPWCFNTMHEDPPFKNKNFWFRISLIAILLWTLLTTVAYTLSSTFDSGEAFWFFISGSGILFIILNMTPWILETLNKKIS
jgi:hypothetical protein